MGSHYDTDTYSWANEQAALLRAGRFDQLAIEHIADEMESVGKSERNALVSQLARLLMPMLKWEHQIERRSRSWSVTISSAQREARDVLGENPGLGSQLDTLLEKAWHRGRDAVVIETGLPPRTFPATCPWTFEEALSFDAPWPD